MKAVELGAPRQDGCCNIAITLIDLLRGFLSVISNGHPRLRRFRNEANWLNVNESELH
jgi:hypothetical protein